MREKTKRTVNSGPQGKRKRTEREHMTERREEVNVMCKGRGGQDGGNEAGKGKREKKKERERERDAKATRKKGREKTHPKKVIRAEKDG